MWPSSLWVLVRCLLDQKSGREKTLGNLQKAWPCHSVSHRNSTLSDFPSRQQTAPFSPHRIRSQGQAPRCAFNRCLSAERRTQSVHPQPSTKLLLKYPLSHEIRDIVHHASPKSCSIPSPDERDSAAEKRATRPRGHTAALLFHFQ